MKFFESYPFDVQGETTPNCFQPAIIRFLIPAINVSLGTNLVYLNLNPQLMVNTTYTPARKTDHSEAKLNNYL